MVWLLLIQFVQDKTISTVVTATGLWLLVLLFPDTGGEDHTQRSLATNKIIFSMTTCVDTIVGIIILH